MVQISSSFVATVLIIAPAVLAAPIAQDSFDAREPRGGRVSSLGGGHLSHGVGSHRGSALGRMHRPPPLNLGSSRRVHGREDAEEMDELSAREPLSRPRTAMSSVRSGHMSGLSSSHSSHGHGSHGHSSHGHRSGLSGHPSGRMSARVRAREDVEDLDDLLAREPASKPAKAAPKTPLSAPAKTSPSIKAKVASVKPKSASGHKSAGLKVKTPSTASHRVKASAGAKSRTTGSHKGKAAGAKVKKGLSGSHSGKAAGSKVKKALSASHKAAHKSSTHASRKSTNHKSTTHKSTVHKSTAHSSHKSALKTGSHSHPKSTKPLAARVGHHSSATHTKARVAESGHRALSSIRSKLASSPKLTTGSKRLGVREDVEEDLVARDFDDVVELSERDLAELEDLDERGIKEWFDNLGKKIKGAFTGKKHAKKHAKHASSAEEATPAEARSYDVEMTELLERNVDLD